MPLSSHVHMKAIYGALECEDCFFGGVVSSLEMNMFGRCSICEAPAAIKQALYVPWLVQIFYTVHVQAISNYFYVCTNKVVYLAFSFFQTTGGIRHRAQQSAKLSFLPVGALSP